MRIFLIILAVVARLIPHPANFTPIGGFALFAGAHFSPRFAWAVPLVALFLSDLLFFGLYDPVSMAFTYSGFLAMTLIGHWIIGDKPKLVGIAGGIVSGSVAFFLLSNFGVFLSGYYGLTFDGLVACYVASIPFFTNQLAGTALYAAVLFGLKALFEQRYGPIVGFAKS